MNPLFRDPQAPIDFVALTLEDVREASEVTMARMRELRDQICAASPHEVEAQLLRRDQLWNCLDLVMNPIYLMKDTHPDEALRDLAGEVLETLFQFSNELSLDEGLFESLRDLEELPQLDPVLRRYREKTMERYLRNGFQLGPEQRLQLKELDEQLIQLELAFQKNISDGERFLDFCEEELDGLPEDFKARHRQPDASYRVSTQMPSYLPVMKFAKSESVRRRLFMEYNNRAVDKNITILDEVLKLRQSRSRLLGFETYAHFHLADTMAKTPEAVWSFLNELGEHVKAKAQADYERLCECAGVARLESWNKAYTSNLYKNRHLDLDEEVIKPYFPLPTVLSALFSIAERLFGIEIVEEPGLPVWEASVRAYQVREAGEVIARFYLDFFPRTGKYNHAACFPLQPGKRLDEGHYQLPQAALVCNFTPPNGDQPSLLTHDELETLFHECGHLFHGLLTRSPLSAFAGTSVVADFVEMPSQILENWAWERASLRELGRHYQSGEPLPEEWIDKLLASKHFNSGLDTQQQIFYSIFDLTLHHRYQPGENQDTTALLYELQRKYTLFEPVEGAHFQANFGHLMGYASAYYGYLWSRVYAEDMFSVFRREGIFQAAVGRRFREEVLAKGDTEEAMLLIERFLGRAPQLQAFLDSLGVSA